MKYSKSAIATNSEGKVLIEFDNTENEKVENFKIKKKGESHASLEEEAKRMVETFQNGWISLTMNGNPAKSQVTITINFKRS